MADDDREQARDDYDPTSTEGIPEHLRDLTLPKFRPGGLLLVHAGGGAGLFSAIIGGWANGDTGSQPTTREVRA